MIVTCAASDPEYFAVGTNQSLKRQSASMEGNMIDALFNVAVFAMLALCIVGFGAWAHKRVDAQ
jgi:hypothetical protein